MKTYKIACVWQMWGVHKVEAESLKEAEEKVLGELGLPEGYYIEDSIEIDKDYTDYGEEGA